MDICKLAAGKTLISELGGGNLGLGKKFISLKVRKLGRNGIKLGFGLGKFKHPDIYPTYLKSVIAEMCP